MLTLRMDIHRIYKAAASLKDDNVFSRPLHVWSTESKVATLRGCLGMLLWWSPWACQAFLGTTREGLSGGRSCWALQTCCLAWHHLAKSHRLNQKYAFVNLLANRGHVLFPGFSFLFPDVSLVTRGAQRELPWKPKSLIISPALSSCLSHCLSQSKLYYPRGGQSWISFSPLLFSGL